MSELTSYPLVFLTALVCALLLMPWLIRWGHQSGTLDTPDDRKIHSSPVPHLGGIAICLAFAASVVLFNPDFPYLYPLLAGLAVIVLTGLADDLWQMRPWVKFSGEIFAALIFLVGSGISLNSFGQLLNAEELTTGRYALAVSVFCIIGVINAFNMADGLDGLAGGLSLVGCVFLGYFSIQSAQTGISIMLFGLSGALIGFLFYNHHPARIFMGDTGSLSLGYLLSAFCILLVQGDRTVQIAPVSMAIVMGLPIVDSLLVMFGRILRGHNPFRADQTHLHHRLLALGFDHAMTVRLCWGLMLLCGSLALVVRDLPEWIQFYIGLACALAIFLPVYLMQVMGFNIRR